MIESEQVFALKVLDPNSNFKIFKRSARDRKWKQIVFEGAGKTVHTVLIIIGKGIGSSNGFSPDDPTILSLSSGFKY